jgi:transcriptional regulator of aromatic amino acid metabolism
MVDFSTLTPENINMFAMKHYDSISCVDEQEFLDDMKRFKYLKRLFRKYDTSKDLKMRLIINHLIILANVFGVDAATSLLFFKIEREHWSILKSFLVFLHYMPENDLVDITINHEVMGKLGQI